MTEKADILEFDEGYEFPPVNYELKPEVMRDYLAAVSDGSGFFAAGEAVPPTMLAARAMISLFEHVSLPDGSIHLQQELRFLKTVKPGDTIQCRGRISRKRMRGRFNLLTVELAVDAPDGDVVMTGKTIFSLPGNTAA
jgi:acyl dehydratase